MNKKNMRRIHILVTVQTLSLIHIFVCSAKRFNADMEAHPEWHSGKTVYSGYPTYRNIRMKGGA